VAFGGGWPCGKFARVSTDLPFFLDHFHQLTEAEKITSSDRALFMLSRCPDDFYYQMSTIPELFDLWLKQSPRLLKTPSTTRESESSVFLATLLSMLKGLAVSNQYKTMQYRLIEKLSTLSSDTDGAQRSHAFRNWQCSLWGGVVIRDTVTDWKRADGAEWKVLSDDFLFLLASCPDNFYAVLADEPAVLREWLEKLPDLSFAAGPDFKPMIEEFRLELVNRLKTQEHNSKYLSVHKSVLRRLTNIRFRIID